MEIKAEEVSKLLREQLEGFEARVDVSEVGTIASVSFRFSTRRDDEMTAFESGIFKYTVITQSGTETTYYIPFEELLVKQSGKWLILMERQLEDSDEAAWSALK